MAAVVHRQETVNCLKTFNARRKLKVCILLLWLTFPLVKSLNYGHGYINYSGSTLNIIPSVNNIPVVN